MRAILLAAGMGTRLRPLTLERPKSLIEVNGKPLLERQIEYLQEVGIKDIIVVTGYLNEKFEYLKGKYNVNIVHNDKYDKYNNVYTMYLVKDYLSDAYVIDADIYLNRNFFERDIKQSTYFSAYKENFKNEWKLNYDLDNKVTSIEVTSGNGYILSGVSFWSKKDSDIIINKLVNIIENDDFKNLYWDDVVKSNLQYLDVDIKKIDTNDVFEIDCLEELEIVKKYLEEN